MVTVDWVVMDCGGFGMVIDKRDGGLVTAGLGSSGLVTAGLGTSAVVTAIGSDCCGGGTAIVEILAWRELERWHSWARDSDSVLSMSCSIC